MSDPSQPGISRGMPTSPTVWQCFLHSVLHSLELRRALAPIPLDEDHAHPTVRALQRGRRHAWLHARHQLHWSMFESIRISVRLAEAFAERVRDIVGARSGVTEKKMFGGIAFMSGELLPHRSLTTDFARQLPDQAQHLIDCFPGLDQTLFV